MTSIDVGPESKRTRIADSANLCLATFQQCLVRASSIHPRESSRIEDQVARFRTWSASIGISAPGRASADHRLRYAPEVYAVIVGLLESLHYRTRTCYDILNVIDKSTTSVVLGSPNEALVRALHDIATELSHLNKISNVIRRASKEARDVRGSEFQIKNDDGDDVEELLFSQFTHLIHDRFPSISETLRQRLSRTMLLRRKRVLYRRHRQEKMDVQPQKAVSRPLIKAPVAESTDPVVQTVLQEVEHTSPHVPMDGVAPSQVRSATTLLQDKFNTVASTPSVVSASKTIPLDQHETLRFPPAPGFVTKQKYEQRKKQRLAAHQSFLDKMEFTRATINTCENSLNSRDSCKDINAQIASAQAELEEALDMDLRMIGEITCPYCLDGLSAKRVFEERRWRNHVVNDLEPYICIIEGCVQPDELYTHSDAWISHLRQHGQYWRCSSHRELGTFSAHEDYIQHLRDDHNAKLSDTKLRALANRNARDSVEMLQSCPLCGSDEDRVEGQLLEHITGHLRSLALISLPSFLDEVAEESESGKNSFVTSQPLSRSTLKDLGGDEVSPLFDSEDVRDHQRPEIVDLDSRNFLGDSHRDWDADCQRIWGLSITIDDTNAKNSLESMETDPILQSMLPQQGGVEFQSNAEGEVVTGDGLRGSGESNRKDMKPDVAPVTLRRPVSELTLEKFLQGVPKFYWRHPDGTRGPAVGIDYEPVPVQLGNSLDDLVDYTDKDHTLLVHLVTMDGKQDRVAAKITEPNAVELLKNEFNILKSLKHKHITAVLGNFSQLRRHKGEPRYGLLLYPLAVRKLQDFLEIISDHNPCYQRQSLTWSPHHDAHRILPYFACLCKTVLFLHTQDPPIEHRYIRPESILIDGADDVLLAEFSLSKAYDVDDHTKPYSSLEGTVMCSPRFDWGDKPRGLEWDVVNLGLVFLEMATVLFGKTLDEMRHPMTKLSASGVMRVNYLEAIADGKMKNWLNVLAKTATSTDWKVPEQFSKVTKDNPDYVQKFLCMIEEMIFARQNTNQLLERAWATFGCLSTHCPHP